MRIRDIMDIKAARLTEHATMQAAAELLVLTQASDLVIVAEDGTFQGIVSEGDIIRTVIPDFDEVLAAGGSMQEAFELFLRAGKSLARVPIKRLIIAEPITVHPDDPLLKAAAVMTTKMIRRLPVVDDGRFIGTVSRADICWALLCASTGRG